MPFYPSIGVGGHCIPIDPTYLSYIASENGITAQFINLANQTNLLMPVKVAKRIQKYLDGNLEGKRIQIAGIAYKKDVPDMRESPAIKLISELENLGAEVFWCDPLVKVFKDSKSQSLNINIDLGLIINPHKEIDLSIWKHAGTKVLDLSSNSEDFGWPKFL
jgi:UDP-N-acetyl-D-glucosamine dehydrogenase